MLLTVFSGSLFLLIFLEGSAIIHIFLRGPKGIGKSTVIQKALALVSSEKPLSIGGFFTYKKEGGDSYIYISAAGQADWRESFRIARHDGHSATACFPQVFEEQGVGFLRGSRHAGLICMDELGFLENEAIQFQREVMACLDGNVPVLGVLRDKEIPWHQPIKAHPSVSVLGVDEENRDALPGLICHKLRRSLQS